MGYGLHITRRADWSSRGDDITFEEWRTRVAADPELEPTADGRMAEWRGSSSLAHPWLEWCDGRIDTSNPDNALLGKMLAIARMLNAHVQGDDGERYDRPDLDAPVREPAPAPRKRSLFGWLEDAFAAGGAPPRAPQAAVAALGFTVGDRVRDAFGNEFVVLAIDPEAQAGLGEIRLRHQDGRRLAYAIVSHSLRRVA